MKIKFSTSWNSSKQPRKQRKYRANAPLHLKKKFVSVNLAKPLRKTSGKRNLAVKKDDKVKVLRGKFKGKQGKVLEVSTKYSKVVVEGLQATKMDGSKVNLKLQPSNLQIIELADRKQKSNTGESSSKVKSETTKKPESKETKQENKVSGAKSQSSSSKESGTKEDKK